ncbi:MAG: Binding-protein-dependent transport systems inner membrane component [Caldanaerobacter subterraneus]|uniref:Binding-protein-dependent transport systems inner membrane component n=2 Tax=Thermoanaerobacter TaxID=1754 RepID=B0K7N0_THEP3|nr:MULTISPECIES: carbohydrate ABC transporter permease [Thermoanaerobacter]KUJ91605.1 MAG: binding-protein-dependent transport system inner membrane protein [Thermoanaerobacter thermocopriae]KUK35153.1 MAG: Binding-protein-dependent transport systems inner membrane component [Caldanaerobacter subterraneus]ABY94279.1 binding-protein-dependent transport systems inner membrane component [Thermoanaerobacter pseudethanolicus ATCC 33223]ADV79232.1 binding-protein-dependent transport systems inner mem
MFKNLKIKKIFHTNMTRLLLILVTFIYMLPLLWMVTTSLKANQDLYASPPKIISIPLVFENYKKATEYFPFWRYFKNSVIITTGVIVGTLFSSPLVAYSFSKINWKGRDILFYIMLSTIMLPFAVTMIPQFLIFKKLGWINTFLPLIIPSFFGNPLSIFLVRQFFMTIPDSLLDAARIDGASELQIYTRIMLPLAKPVLFLITLFTFIGAWNNYLGPLIYLTDESKYPLALGLPQFLDRYGTYWNWMMAAATISVVPTIIFFAFAQKYLIEGIKLTGLKE